MLLPAELVDHIFCFLDTPALKACSKAHPLYSKLAERHIYTDIVVHPKTVSELYEHLFENPRFLDYPHTLNLDLPTNRLSLSIMLMIPRMANLTSLRINGPQYVDFISTFTISLHQSSIEELYLSRLHGLPLSVLDSCKNIKKLALSSCTAKEEEPIPSSPSSQLSLQTLILSGYHDEDIHSWALRWITHLTSLALRDLDRDYSSALPAMLRACSNSLTRLHLDLWSNYTSTYSYDADHHSVGHWSDNHETLRFTLSALTHLKSLSIFALITSDATSIECANATHIECALPEIIRLIQTASTTIQHFVLYFHWHISDSVTSIGRLDWSLLDRLQSGHSARTRPRIDLYVTGEGIVCPEYSPECILKALAESKVLMDLMKQGLVNLKSEPALVSWSSEA